MPGLTQFENWGRGRAMALLARMMPTREIDARTLSESLRKNPSPRILLIGLYQKMGQFLCATPLIRTLAEAWPQATLEFLGNPVNAVPARANPHLARVWVWKKNSPWEWPGQLWALRREHFDLALLLTTERPSATGVLVARKTDARVVAAYVSPNGEQWGDDATALCHLRIPSANEKNEVEKYLGLARAFGLNPHSRQPEFQLAPADQAAAETFFAAQKPAGPGPHIGLFIGGKAERADRLWPVTAFARLAETLEKSGAQIFVISPPPANSGSETFLSDEHLRLAEFRQAFTGRCVVIQEASLGRVAAFLGKLDLLICPDGGILHLAAAVGTPTIGLFFSTDPQVWRHEGRQTALDGRGRPTSELRPETVEQEALLRLKEARPV